MKITTFTKKDLHYSIIGQNIDQAVRLMKKYNIEHRVLTKNSIVSCEYVTDRMNIIVDDTTKNVIDAYIG